MEGRIYPKQRSSPSSPLSYFQRFPSKSGCHFTSGARLRSLERTAKTTSAPEPRADVSLTQQRPQRALHNVAAPRWPTPPRPSTPSRAPPANPPRGRNALPRRPRRPPAGAPGPLAPRRLLPALCFHSGGRRCPLAPLRGSEGAAEARDERAVWWSPPPPPTPSPPHAPANAT